MPCHRGDNTYGQLDVPPGLDDVSTVSAGYYHTCAVGGYYGTTFCWGDASASAGASVVPALYARYAVMQVSAGKYFTCMLTYSYQVHCWGSFGQPNPLGAINKFYSSVTTGIYHACALTRRFVQCWAAVDGVDFGQTNVPAVAASTVDPSTGDGMVISVSAGEYHVCAALVTGSTVCWGANSPQVDSGQTQVPVAALSGVVSVSAGARHTCASKQDNTIVCWGSSQPAYDFGQTTVPLSLRAGMVCAFVLRC